VVDRCGQSAPAPELTLVGDGPQRLRLERLVADLGLSGCVRLTGALPRSGVVAELQRAHAFALPVRTRLAGLNPEGLGLAALEAAACGLPVVVGRSGGAPETVRDGRTGYVVPPADHYAVAARLVELLADPARSRTMGEAGRRFVAEQFSADRARRTLRAALDL
jgi:phosphatidyl-myo-inositol dimannoside synthase